MMSKTVAIGAVWFGQPLVPGKAPVKKNLQIVKMYNHVGGFGHLLIMGQAGFLDHDETGKGMTLFAKEVYPRLQDLGPVIAP